MEYEFKSRQILLLPKLMNHIKYSILLSFLLITEIHTVAQNNTKIVNGEFYRKTAFGLEQTKDYLSGDSTFLLQLTLSNVDTLNTLTVAWYLDGFEGSQPQRIDSMALGIKNVQRKFAVSYSRNSIAFPVGFYYTNVYLNGKFQERYSFKVLAEPVLSGQFLKSDGDEKVAVTQWNKLDKHAFLRVFFDRYVVQDSSQLEAVFFFEMAGDEPLFLSVSKYTITGDFNYVDFPLNFNSEIPQGYIVAEIWVNGEFKKYFRVEVK